MIAIHEIHAGDQVEIRDPEGNRARGRVTISHNHARTQLTIAAFGVAVPFAQHTPGGWQKVAKLDVIAHQPMLDLG